MGCAESSPTTVRPQDIERSQTLERQLRRSRSEKERYTKLLLLGPGNSGKSTFFKQLLYIHEGGFSEQHRVDRKTIHSALLRQIYALSVSAVSERGLTLWTVDSKVQEYCNDFINNEFTDITEALAQVIEEWWNDAGVKSAFKQKRNLAIVDSTPHFLDRIQELWPDTYTPTEDDILLVRTPTTGINKNVFVATDGDYSDEDADHKSPDDSKKTEPGTASSSRTFVLYDCGGQKSERSKWIRVFDDVTAILFVASLSCFDQTLYEDDTMNAMVEGITLFDELTNSRWFRRTAVILFLNKEDLFDTKISRVPLSVCFEDYEGDVGDALKAKEFIRDKFVEMNAILTRKIFTHYTQATHRNNVRKVFHNVQNVAIEHAMQCGRII